MPSSPSDLDAKLRASAALWEGRYEEACELAISPYQGGSPEYHTLASKRSGGSGDGGAVTHASVADHKSRDKSAVPCAPGHMHTAPSSSCAHFLAGLLIGYGRR